MSRPTPTNPNQAREIFATSSQPVERRWGMLAAVHGQKADTCRILENPLGSRMPSVISPPRERYATRHGPTNRSSYAPSSHVRTRAWHCKRTLPSLLTTFICPPGGIFAIASSIR